MPGMSSIVKKENVTKKEIFIKENGIAKSKNKEKEAEKEGEKEAEKAEKEVVADDDDYKDENRRYVKFLKFIYHDDDVLNINSLYLMLMLFIEC